MSDFVIVQFLFDQGSQSFFPDMFLNLFQTFVFANKDLKEDI